MSDNLAHEKGCVERICMIGSGTWGIALARLMALQGHRVEVWSESTKKSMHLDLERSLPQLSGVRIPENVRFTDDLERACKEATIIVFATASQYVRGVAKTIARVVDFSQIIVCATKGLEADSLFSMTAVIEDELTKAGSPCNALVAFSGPTHAEEVARDMPSAIVAASAHRAAALRVQKAFSNEVFRIYTGSDVKGVELCGALKNVVALASGMAAGLGYGDNSRAALIARGIAEMTRLGVAAGCRAETFSGLAGVGDLVVTASSVHSRNYRAGFLIAGGMSVEEAVAEVGMVVEGLNALPAAVQLSARYGVDMPIVDAVQAVVSGCVRPQSVVGALMKRKLTCEAYVRKQRTVMTYGTFDLLHYGHINLLRRARALGDRLIVAISTDEFNWNEKKKRCYFSYEQRKTMVEAVGYVDEVVQESSWDQKRRDMHAYDVDVFAMGDDWAGRFDFLKDEGVDVVYLPRTPEISTTQIKTDMSKGDKK